MDQMIQVDLVLYMKEQIQSQILLQHGFCHFLSYYQY